MGIGRGVPRGVDRGGAGAGPLGAVRKGIGGRSRLTTGVFAADGRGGTSGAVFGAGSAAAMTSSSLAVCSSTPPRAIWMLSGASSMNRSMTPLRPRTAPLATTTPVPWTRAVPSANLMRMSHISPGGHGFAIGQKNAP